LQAASLTPFWRETIFGLWGGHEINLWHKPIKLFVPLEANTLTSMNCKNCGEAVPKDELNCPACGTIAARSKADLQKTDPAMTKGIAWALIAMGVFGLIFVIANAWTDWYSGLDYVGPVGLLLLGGVTLFTASRKK